MTTTHPGKIPQIKSASLKLRIGIVYDQPEDYEVDNGPPDRFAEFEPESTIEVMEQAITVAGHQPVRIGPPHRLLRSNHEVDLVWNIGEGYGTRNREAWTPVLCEMRGIPILGSDAYTLTVTLDKVLTKQIARNLGIPVADWTVISDWNTPKHRTSGSNSEKYDPGSGFTHTKHSGSDIPPADLPLPLFLKPRYEGTSKGITENSVVHTPEQFREQCRHILVTYDQDVMAETFLSGAELTCAMAYHPLKALPVVERGLHRSGIGSHAVQSLSNHDVHTSDALTPHLEEQITMWSIRLAEALEIRDYARCDFKLDESGNPYFLEVNPLPTFALDSTYAILAELQDMPYPEFLSGILCDGIRRLRSD